MVLLGRSSGGIVALGRPTMAGCEGVMASILEKAQELLAIYGPPSPGAAPRIAYRMGADLDGIPLACDCSAFAARCCGQRKFDGKLYYNTDRIWDDAQGPRKRWRQIPAPAPGCIGVYPGKTVAGKRHAGHVWVVADPATARTIECSDSGKGIAAKKRPAWFKPGATGNGRPIIWAEFVG